MPGSCCINFGMKFKYCWDSLNKCFFFFFWCYNEAMPNRFTSRLECKWRIKVTHLHILGDLKCNSCSILKELIIRSLGCWSKICFCLLNKDYRCFHPEEVEHTSNVSSQMLFILFSFPRMWPHDTFEMHITLPVHYLQNEGFIPSLIIFYLVASILLVGGRWKWILTTWKWKYCTDSSHMSLWLVSNMSRWQSLSFYKLSSLRSNLSWQPHKFCVKTKITLAKFVS